jgi:hypothetical protein
MVFASRRNFKGAYVKIILQTSIWMSSEFLRGLFVLNSILVALKGDSSP